MKTKLISAAGLLLVLMMLSGCSSTQQARNTGTAQAAENRAKLDACALLTRADAGMLMGEAAGPPTSSQMGETVSRCGYMSKSGGKRVSLLARQASSRNEAAEIFKKAQNESKSLSGSEPQVIAGLGDAAFWAGGNLKQLNVLKNDVWLIISANLGGDDPIAASKSAAKRGLAHFE